MRRSLLVATSAVLVMAIAGLVWKAGTSSDAARAAPGAPIGPPRSVTGDDDAREPVRGMMLGQPLGTGGGALPSGGRHPCAADPAGARTRLEQFFSVVRQPVLSVEEQAFRERQGWPPLVRTRYLPETVAAARVTRRPMLFRVELPAEPDILYEDDARRYPFLRTWYVLDCASLEYLNLDYGRYVPRRGAYPFDDLGDEHFVTVQAEWDMETGPRRLTFLREEYANRQNLARAARPLRSVAELEDVADFLYRVGRVPLSGFNSAGKLVGRGGLELPAVMAVEDTVHWTVYDDAVEPDGTVQPPHEFRVVHVYVYERATREIVHHAFPEDQPERDRPYASIHLPGDGAAFRRTVDRRVTFSGSARHGREILSPDRMEWVSDRDGRLATGIGARLRVSDLSAGAHVVTFRVCDAIDRCAADSRTIVVE